jgi:hypothetical protein
MPHELAGAVSPCPAGNSNANVGVVYIARFTHFYGAEAQPHLRILGILGIGKLTNSSFYQFYVLTLNVLSLRN